MTASWRTTAAATNTPDIQPMDFQLIVMGSPMDSLRRPHLDTFLTVGGK